MKLQTQIHIPERKPKLDYSSKLLLLGSCFSENIGEKFQYYKFQSLQNPFGILFHPFGIENFLKRASLQQHYQKDEVFEHNEAWSCFDAHSRLNALDENSLLEKLNAALKETHQFIKEATHIVITLGTSWVYKDLKSDKYVANCHKIPQKNFQKELTPISVIQQSIANSIQYIQQLNPDVHFIFTVSPVRHIKDGFVENQQSKAHLIAALHQSIFSVKQASYFPSYEIMMDELRDYRFYAVDLIHPNTSAIQYIWEKFSVSWIDSTCNPIMKEVENIQQALQHKPFNPASEAHQNFQKNLQQKIDNLIKQYPHFKF